MSRVQVSSFRANLPSALAFVVIALLAGVLIERRVLTPRPAPDHSLLDAIPTVGADIGPPGLRRIVLDPCTGLEKANVGARTAKAD